jgi:hypothetical protein
MRQGWEGEAQNWVKFARTPGYDHAHAETNMPALLDLLPAPGRATLDVACGERKAVPAVSSSLISPALEKLGDLPAGDRALAGQCPGLTGYLARVPDPRDPRGVRHALTSLLLAAFAPLLAPLDLAGAVVTADALHAQREHARFLVTEKNAHYLLAVKTISPACTPSSKPCRGGRSRPPSRPATAVTAAPNGAP